MRWNAAFCHLPPLAPLLTGRSHNVYQGPSNGMATLWMPWRCRLCGNFLLFNSQGRHIVEIKLY